MSDKPQKPPKDINQLAKHVLGATIGEAEKIVKPEVDPKMKKLSELGAAKGGEARKNKLTPEERSAIAKKAAKPRWKKS